MRLNWHDNSSDEKGFKIERKTGAGGTYAQVGTVGIGITTYTNTGPVPGTLYYYRVKAYNLGGNSAPTSEVSATTLKAPTLASPSSGATGQSLTPTLRWNAVTGTITGYRFQLATGSTFATVIYQVDTDSATTQCVIPGSTLAYNTTYYWHVMALNGSDVSSWSAYRTFKTLVMALPDPPSGLTATAIASNKVQLSWVDNSSNEAGFKIERKTGAGAYSQVGTVLAGIQTYTNTSVSGGYTYTYRVRAYNLGGNSGYTDEVPVTTLKAPTLSSPASGAMLPGLTATLGWNAVTNATSYSVQVATASTFAPATIVVDVNSIGGLSYMTSPLNPVTTYYWHVSAQNTDGTSSWSAYRSFKTSP